jgi:hypothetical protein
VHAQIDDILKAHGLAKAIGSIEQQRAVFASMGSGGKGGKSKVWPRGKNGKRSPHAGPKSNTSTGVHQGGGGGSGGGSPAAHPKANEGGAVTPVRAPTRQSLEAKKTRIEAKLTDVQSRKQKLADIEQRFTAARANGPVPIDQLKGFRREIAALKSPPKKTKKMMSAPLQKAADLTPTWHGWAAITKVDEEKRFVYGIASSELPDNEPGIWKGESYQGDIISSAAMRDAAPDYLKYPAIREMHQPSAAGTAVHFAVNGAETEIGAIIIDDQAWAKVVNKVYRGFSIGGRCKDAEIVKIDGRPFRKVTKLELTEISLVDRPRNPQASITLFKGVDMAEQDDATEVADSTELAKAADPTKAIALLQQLRNDAETSGDMDAADEYTAAIRSVAQAAGIATTAEDDEDADLSDDSALALDDGGDDTGDVAMAASVGDLRKAHPELSDEGLITLLLTGTTQSAAAITKRGAMLSSANLSHAKTAHDALQKMTGGAVCAPNNGQPNGIAMAATLAPDDLAKALTPAFDGIAKGLEKIGVDVSGLTKRLEHLESQPAPGGPAARVVSIEKVLPGTEPPAAPSTEEAELSLLRKLRDSATDDTTRKALADDITKREIRKVYRPIE